MAGADDRRDYDLAILGSGIACTHTLLTFLGSLPATDRPFRIAVVESGGEFWRGFPYGRRSSPNSLIITTFQEFVPDDEHAEFTAWLSERRRHWTRSLAEKGGEAAARWLADNAAAIEAGDWNALYIPRQLYGDFAEEKIRRAIAGARSAGLATVDEIAGEALALDRIHAGYGVGVARNRREYRIEARVVLIATGSPPYRMLPGADDCGPSNARLYVNNAYLPGLSENIAAMAARLRAEPAQDRRNLLVVGSNATSLELLYMIARDSALLELLNKIVVLSNGGVLPHRMTGAKRTDYDFPRMRALAISQDVTPRRIMSAVQADFEEASRDLSNAGDMFHQMSDQLVQLLEKLDDAAQREFHHVYGMQFTRIVRRAGSEYRDAAQELLDQGKLELVAGRFDRISSLGNSGFSLTYEAAQATIDDERSFAVVFNCAGFEDVSERSSSGLLSSLVGRKLVKVNPTGRGLEVDETFSAAPGLYVCGPLLGGVFNDSVRYWHVENVRRIQAVASRLGPCIAERVSQKAQEVGTLP